MYSLFFFQSETRPYVGIQYSVLKFLIKMRIQHSEKTEFWNSSLQGVGFPQEQNAQIQSDVSMGW